MKAPPPPSAVGPEPEAEDLAAVELAPPGQDSLVHHPDGWYWLDADGDQEFGPYETAEAALAAMNEAGEESLECGETLEEAEQELGLADWIDPDTGELAEGTHTRIEDH